MSDHITLIEIKVNQNVIKGSKISKMCKCLFIGLKLSVKNQTLHGLNY